MWRLGHSLRASLYKGSVVRQGKRLHINVLELKVVSPAFQRFKDQCQNQTVLVVDWSVSSTVSSPRPKCLGHRCSEHKLVGSHCLCLPSHCSPSQGDPKSQAIQLSNHCNSPRLARNALVLRSSAALNRDPTATTVSRTLLKQSHNYVLHNNRQHLNLHAWCLGVDSYKNKASLWRWQRELLLLRGNHQGPSTSQSGPYLRNGAEKIRWISPLPLRRKSSTSSCTCTKT